LGSGIYDLALAPYASPLGSYDSGPITSASTVSYTARGVGPGTSLYIAFWNSLNAAGISGVSITDTATTYLWNGGVSGVWTNGGSGWTDQFDNTATTYNNAKPVVAQFTNASAGTNVTVGGNVVVGNVQVGGTNYTFSGGSITMTNTTWSVAASRTANVGSSLAGTTGLTKSDSGTLALGASNSYGGTTVVNAGTLTIADGNALGSTAAGTTVASGAQLRLTATNSGFTVGNEALTISGDGVSSGGALRNAAGSNTWQGKVTLATNATIGSASGSTLTLDVASGGNAIEASNFNLTFDGAGTNVVNDAISLGTGSLTKTGSGLAILAASNSYSGGTTLSLGTLALGNANALGSGNLTVNGGTLDLGGNNLTAADLGGTGGTISLGANTLTASMTTGGQFNGTISGSGGLVKTGASFLTLAGSNSYTGGTTVSEGTLFVTGAGTLGNGSGAITISNTTSTATLDLRNAQARTGTITMIGQGARLASEDVNNPGSLINNGNALEMGGGQITVSVSGTGGLNVTGGGTINSANSYTGATTISGTTGWYGTDQLFVNNANALGDASGGLTISGGSVNLQGNTITRSGNVTISGGVINNGTLSKSGGNFALQGGTVFASLAGTAGLIKSTTNGASLNASNSYTGGTTISGGTLFVGGSGTLGDASGDVTVSGTGSASTEVVLDLRSQQTRTGTITMTNQDARIINGGGGSIVNNGAFRFGGGLLDVGVSGTGGLNVTGGGGINSSNSYTGATTISGTTGWYGQNQLFVNNTNALGAASGDLTISGGNVNLQTNTISRSGNVTISGGTLTTGTLNKTGGVFALPGGDASIAVTLAGTAGLTKSGAGTSYLWLSNSYTGATTISGGTLVTDGEGQLTAGTTLAVSNGATWQMTGANSTTNGATRTIGGLTGDGTVQTTTSGFTHNLAVNKASGSDTFSGVIAGSGALVKQGTGTLGLGGANTYSGDTLVSAGVLRIGNSSALGSTNGGTVVESGAQLRLITGVAGATSYGNGESLTISGDGGSYTGALRSGVSGETNTYQGKVSLAANASINAGSGTGLILDVASGDAVDLGGNTLTFVGAGTHAVNDRIVGTGGIIKTGTGTMTLAASNNFTGATAVTGGVLNLDSSAGSALGSTSSVSVATSATLLVSQSSQVNDNAAVTLSGGTIQRASGVSEVFGNLNITAASFLNFGSGTAGNLQFQSYTNTGSALVTVQNFFQGNSIQFASATFNSGNLAQFSFDNGYTTSIGGGYFTITAIPEPSTVIAAAGLLSLMLLPACCRQWRRVRFSRTALAPSLNKSLLLSAATRSPQ
jgi:autotransporter-associated beta strand protein